MMEINIPESAVVPLETGAVMPTTEVQRTITQQLQKELKIGPESAGKLAVLSVKESTNKNLPLRNTPFYLKRTTELFGNTKIKLMFADARLFSDVHNIPHNIVRYGLTQQINTIKKNDTLAVILDTMLENVKNSFNPSINKTFFFPDQPDQLIKFNITAEQFTKLEEILKKSFPNLSRISSTALQKCIQDFQTNAANEGLKSQADLASYIKCLHSVYGTGSFPEILERATTLELLLDKASAEIAQKKVQAQLDTLQRELLPHFNNGLRALAWGMDALANLINFEIQAIVFLMEPDHFSRDRLMRALGSTLEKVAAEPLWWITTGLHKKKIEDMQQDEKMAVLTLSVLYDGVGEDTLMKRFSQLSINEKTKFLTRLGELQTVIQTGGKGLLKGGTWNWQRLDKTGNEIETVSSPVSPGLLTALQQDRNGVQELIKKCGGWLTIEQKQYEEQTTLFQQAEARLPTQLSNPLEESPEDLYGHLQGLVKAIDKGKGSLTPNQQSRFNAIQAQVMKEQLNKTLQDQPLVAVGENANQNDLNARIEGAFKAALLGPYDKALRLYHEILRTPALSPEGIQIISVFNTTPQHNQIAEGIRTNL